MARITIGSVVIDTDMFETLPSSTKKDFMRNWFRENYENPWNNLHYDHEEGWIWGDMGPCDAHDELEQVFGDLVTETELLDAALEIEKGGLVWARREGTAKSPLPGSYLVEDVNVRRYVDTPWRELNHKFQLKTRQQIAHTWALTARGLEDLPTPASGYAVADSSFVGDSFVAPTRRRPPTDLDRRLEAEKSARAALKTELEKARREIQALKDPHPRNHNRPPEELEADRDIATQVTNISITIQKLEVNMAQPRPDLVGVKEELSRLRAIMKWCGGRMTASVDAIVPAVALVYASSPEQVNALAARLYNATIVWVDAALRLIS